MKANEIRLGNLFKCYNFDLTIGSINKEYVGHITNEGGFLITDLEPIPLTEEWLVKFGFEKRVGEIFMYHTWFYIDKECAGVSGWYFRGIDAFKSKIEYVHQLQNLYFALTGEELTLKENE